MNRGVECAVLFADIADSTGLYARHGDAQARRIISRCLAAMSRISRIHGGVVIKTIGDEVMCRFARADEAVRAACGIHEALAYRERFDGLALAAHIGLHFGLAFLEDGDVQGDAANVAANMTAIAKPRQAITTHETVARLSPALAALTRRYDIVSLKGQRQETPIHEILWERDEVTAIVSRLDAGAVALGIRLSYHARELVITPAAPALVGRGRDCDLIVEASLVSRVHARIEHRRGKFVLIDQSTNGTYVQAQDGQEVYLRREEMPLVGSGCISLGKSTRQAGAELVYYSPL